MPLQHKNLLFILCLMLGTLVNAQSPTISSFTPTKVTQRTEVTINGTNFTASSTVSFGGTAAASVTYVSSTKLLAIVSKGSSGSVSVNNGAGTATKTGLTYVAPTTPAGAAVTRVVTDWNSYWSSTEASATTAIQPDTHHNLLAFRYGSTTYSTGVSNSTLTANSVSYTSGDYRALPVNSISGNTSAANFISLGNKIDGNATATDYLSPSVTGLKVQDVLIDGTKGLGLGSGVTNINSTAVLLFNVSTIVNSKISDSQPDIIITQTADPSENLYDIFCFVDASGNIVGNPVQANFYTVSPVGTYKVDLFTLTTGQPYSTVTPSANGAAGGNTRDIRMVAFKLVDFGLSSANSASVSKLKYMPSGQSDPAFMAYNAGAVTIPAPVITQQPQSVAICPGTGNATFTVTATGTGLSYQWRKNTIDIAGATSPTYTITSPQASDVASYSVVVTNASGSVMSNIVYLNTIISLQPESISTCINNTQTLSFTSNGSNLTYQWYANTVAGNTGGTAIPGATLSSYSPPVNIAGSKYYYCVVTNEGSGCAGATTDAALFTVSAATVAGTPSASTTICSGNTTTLTLTGYTGSIQWQQSTNNSTWNDITGATAATYTTGALTQTTYYRARVASGACAAATTASTTVTVTAAPVAGTASGTQEICPGTTASLAVSGYIGNLQWQQSTNGTDGWATVTGGAGAITAGYTTAVLTETTYYRARIYNAGCAVTTNVVTVSVRSNTWTGVVSSNWHVAGNWDCNAVPNLYHNVIIAPSANQATVSAQAKCKSMIVQNNAALTVNGGSSLTITNAINVESTGVATFDDEANLIQTNNVGNTGNITVHKNSSQLFRQDYTFWSSPVAGQELYSFSPNTVTAPVPRFYIYGAAEDEYLYVNPFGTTFATAQAYLIRMPNDHPTPGYDQGLTSIVYNGSFTGVPHNGNITYPLISQGGRYNSVGNPYPSPISVKDFFLANATALEAGEGIYFWRKKNNASATSYAVLTLAGFVANSAQGGNPGESQFGGGQWSSYFNNLINGNWVIKPGQGFIIRAAAGGTALTFTNSMRRDQHNGAFFRTTDTEPGLSRIWLNLTGNDDAFSQTAIVYSDETTLGIDFGWDGRRMAGGEISLYSIAGEETLAIQARPAFTSTDIVPLGYSAQNAGTFVIALDHKDGVFANGQEVYLKDNTLDVLHDLNTGNYSFATEAGTFSGRFEVWYAPADVLKNGEAADTVEMVIYKDNSGLHIKSQADDIANVVIYDVRGRAIYTSGVSSAAEITINNLVAEQQMLVVKVTTVNNKVFYKRIVY